MIVTEQSAGKDWCGNPMKGATVELSLDEIAGVYDLPTAEVNRATLKETEYSLDHSSDWYGPEGSRLEYQGHAEGYLRNGWYEGVRQLLALKKKIDVPAPVVRRRTRTWGAEGETVHLDRAIAGNWEQAWQTTTRSNARGPVTIDVVALCGGHGNRSSQELFWGGASAVVLADALESAGYGVRLLGATIARCPGGTIGVLVTLKEAGEPCRPDVIAAYLCHAGIHRTHNFRARHLAPLQVGDGMGSTLGWDDNTKALVAGVVSPNAIHLTHTYDQASCYGQIERVLKDALGAAWRPRYLGGSAGTP